MKILLCPYNWQHSTIAGGEVYLMRLSKYLLEQGHEIRAIVGSKEVYTDERGIGCIPQGDGLQLFTEHNDLVKWCDVIITHLLGSSYGYNRSNQHNKPLIFIAHNNSKNYAPIHGEISRTYVIYNSYQLRDDLHKAFGHFNGIVLHPFGFDRERQQGEKITLINCNHNKGGHIFGEIARRLPQYQFLGVFGGYGEQIEAHLPNITYLPNKSDMNAVYASTRILLMPSEFESYGQAGSEAMECGIPVIAHPCPGIRENLSDAGIFIDRNNIDGWVNSINALMTNNTYYWRQSEIVYQRAMRVREMSADELVKLNEWLGKIEI